MPDFEPRTVQEIQEAMLADKATKSALDVITTTSNASVFLNLVNVFAASVNLHENAFLAFANEVETRASQLQVGTPQWYAFESLLFQLGDPLVFQNGFVTYEVIDEEKQIIKLAAADKENGFLVIKVAKLNASGQATPLSAGELTAFQEYWDQKKFACTPIIFISQDGDIARITYRIGVDATVIDPNTGQLLTDTSVRPVEDAINAFLQSFQSERFNSLLRIADLTDAIQAVPGVINPVPVDVQARPINGTFISLNDNPNEEYLARAGFIVHDETTGFTLLDLLTYYIA